MFKQLIATATLCCTALTFAPVTAYAADVEWAEPTMITAYYYAPSVESSTVEYPDNISNLNTLTRLGQVTVVSQAEEPETVEAESEPTIVKTWTDEDEIMLAKTVYGEAQGLQKMEQAAVVWCILNRVDQGIYGGSIKEVVTAKYQFIGYKASHPVWDSILEVVRDVLNRWALEKAGETDVGRVLPSQYTNFYGDGKHNYFYTNASKKTWNWDCVNPYV